MQISKKKYYNKFPLPRIIENLCLFPVLTNNLRIENIKIINTQKKSKLAKIFLKLFLSYFLWIFQE